MSRSNSCLLFFFLLFLISGIEGKTQDSIKAEPWDRSKVDYRPASVEKMEAYKIMPEYIYDRFEKPESWWDKFKRWFWSQVVVSNLSNKIILYVLIGIAVLILLFVILKLIGIEISGLFIFTKNNKVTNLNFKQGEDDIYNDNLEKTLSIAIKNKAYREAVRILYLLNLKHLDSAAFIDWKPWKTNKDYYYELTSKEYQSLFKKLVIQYEYIWYGQFNIEENGFVKIQSCFDEFEQLINSKKIRI